MKKQVRLGAVVVGMGLYVCTAQGFPNVVKACRSECPNAVLNEDAAKCVEARAAADTKFKKTHCYKVYERFERVTAKNRKSPKPVKKGMDSTTK